MSCLFTDSFKYVKVEPLEQCGRREDGARGCCDSLKQGLKKGGSGTALHVIQYGHWVNLPHDKLVYQRSTEGLTALTRHRSHFKGKAKDFKGDYEIR